MARTAAALAVMATAVAAAAAAAEDGAGSGSSSGGLSPTAVGVLIVGVVVVLALLGILWWFMRRRRAKNKPAQAATPATAAREDATAGFFMTAFSPPSSSYGKTIDSYNGAGVHFDVKQHKGVPRPTPVPSLRPNHYAPQRQGRMPGTEPLLYNREATTTLRINDSTRSYLYEPTTPPDRAAVDATPKIFSSKNSVDLTYVDTNRSNIELVDSTPTALRAFVDGEDSNRSNDMDPYAFVVQTNESAQLFSIGDEDSARSSRPYLDDSERSSRLYMDDSDRSSRLYLDDSERSSRLNMDDESHRSLPTTDASARTTVYNEDIETNALNTQELRHIKVEL